MGNNGIPVFQVQKGETVAAKRKIPIPLVLGSNYVTPKTGTLAGSPKAKLSRDFGTQENSDNAYTQLDATNHPGIHVLELSTDEVDDNRRILVTIKGGGAFGQAFVDVVTADPLTEGASSSRLLSHKAGKPK